MLLEQAGWVVQDRDRMNLDASLGVVVREFPLPSGATDYLLFIDFEPVGIVEDLQVALEQFTAIADDEGRRVAVDGE